MLRWFKQLTKPKSDFSEEEKLAYPTSLSEEKMHEESTKNDVPDHQQKIIELIQSDDIQNHRLASVMSSGIPIKWNTALVNSICRSASKLSFWLEEKSDYDFTQLNELVIGPRFFTKYAQIDSFSALIDKLSQLRSFKWEAGPYWNVLKILNSLSGCPQLEEISIKKAKINFFPQSILSFEHLKRLDLSDNQLIEIPEELEQLQELTSLQLSGNRLNRCPRVISRLKKLEALDLRDNPLKTINPKILGRLYKLKDLRLPPPIATHYFNELKDWLPGVDFQQEHWTFEDDQANNF